LQFLHPAVPRDGDSNSVGALFPAQLSCHFPGSSRLIAVSSEVPTHVSPLPIQSQAKAYVTFGHRQDACATLLDSTVDSTALPELDAAAAFALLLFPLSVRILFDECSSFIIPQ